MFAYAIMYYKFCNMNIKPWHTEKLTGTYVWDKKREMETTINKTAKEYSVWRVNWIKYIFCFILQFKNNSMVCLNIRTNFNVFWGCVCSEHLLRHSVHWKQPFSVYDIKYQPLNIKNKYTWGLRHMSGKHKKLIC